VFLLDFQKEQDDISQAVKAVKFTEEEKCKTELFIENTIKLWNWIMKSKIMTLAQAVLKSDNSKSLAAALFYGTCSVSMNFLNKAVVSSYNFNYPFFIMVCQMVTTIIFLDTIRMAGYLNIAPYSLRDGKDFLPASLLFALHATLSLFALHGMNIPMYGAIKRCTPLVSLILSVVVLRKSVPSKAIVISILLITFGCLVASIGDLEFDGHAYFMGMLSVFAQGGYLTLVQRSSLEMKKSTLEMIHINGFNTLPFFTIMSMLIMEPIKIAESNSFFEDGFFPVFITLIISGCILTFSQFLCASVCSAITASLVGVGKSVLQTVIGFFTFGGVRFHPLNILGLVLNTIGGALYSYVKYRESERKKQKNEFENNHPSIADLVNSSQSEKETLISSSKDQNGYRRNFNQESVNYENEHTKTLG